MLSSPATATVEASLTPADRLFRVDDGAQSALRADKPWLRDPKYFTTVKVSAAAAMKMVGVASAC